MQIPTSEAEQQKRRSARRACDEIRDGMVLGLGTGSTVRYVLQEIAERRSAGGLRDVTGVPTSRETAERAGALGIPLCSLAECPHPDLTLDGADEVDPELRLIKGLGGALLREKIIAVASRRLLIVADQSKTVDRLGTRAPLPVEVDPFSAPVQPEFLSSLGAEPALRRAAGGEPFVTDGGHWIYDCRFPDGIVDPEVLCRELNWRPGIVEHGLFLGIAWGAVIAGPDGTQVRMAAEGETKRTAKQCATPGW